MVPHQLGTGKAMVVSATVVGCFVGANDHTSKQKFREAGLCKSFQGHTH